MKQLFQKAALSTNATGVQVSLDTIDPDGNLVHIGDTPCDASSNYGIAFTPEVPGKYQIIATFAGSNSYDPSFGTTYVVIGNEAPTPSPLPQLKESIADRYLIPATIDIIIAILAIGIVIILMLRKRA
jgi:hypothetical protein